MNYLPCLEVEPQTAATAAVIWLHGLGASGDDFAPIVPELDLGDLAVRFIFPHAPSRPVTINNGMVMPAWYDIFTLDIDRKIDEEQILQSAQAIHDLIDREIERGIAAERIIVAGFSQGGAVSYQAALSYPKPLGGLMTLSTYFATSDTVAVDSANQPLPVFVSHGLYDSVVPEVLGQRAVELLKAKSITAEYKTYPMDHEVCMPQIRDISQWLTTCLSN
ncbi:MAG: phospholipase/carboxylesterase [Candidatus Pelagadaptatus aseana]|uniref:alpha/beta hydrolase n=1 Tax=Candidatus Pelagadaptatus aseana TaxID=3120508 RepID=UPI0039B1A2A7